MTAQPLRAAIYLRISMDRENTRLGVDRHRREAKELIKQRGWILNEIYEDNDISGAGHRKRKNFERLLTDIKDGLVDVVVAQEWPRLERNRAEGVRIIEACQHHGVLLTFVKGNDINTTTAAGRLIADFMSSLARHEIETKSERQSGGQLQRAAQGRAPKGVRPLGYGISGDVIPHEAEAVKKIYEYFRTGSSIRAIAAGLSGQVDSPDEDEKRIPNLPTLPRHNRTLMLERNAKRVETNASLPKEQQLLLRPVPEDGHWPPSTVLGILRNPRYAGYSTYTPKELPSKENPTEELFGKRRSWRASILRDDANEPVKGQWKHLIDEDVWWAVQEKLDDPTRKTNGRGTERRHIGSGLYLCSICDAPVRGHSSQYRCAGHVMRSREQIDAFVQIAVREVLGNDDLANLLPQNDGPRLRAINEELSQRRAKVLRAEHDYDAQIIEGRDLKRVREREVGPIEALEKERINMTVGSSASPVLSAKDPVKAFDESDLAAKRGVIDALCEVRLFPHPRGVKKFDPGTVQITWRG